VAGQVQDAGREGDAAATLVGNAEARRSSVSGVSLDEEMLTLITQQQAYTAATRIVQIADEMMDDLLNMI
jgi:flagellar hook-associated protein 1 FlgK